jgi:5-dehydro-2-deoxygluconokinase
MSDKPLLILAADDRMRDLYGLTAAPTPAQTARISADKLLIYEALLDATHWLPAEVQPGVLIDEQYGASVAELASQSAGAVSLCMPLEAGDDWERHADFFAAEHPKVLVRDSPGLDPGRLSQVSAWAAGAGRSLILELRVGPGHTLEAMEYLQDHGVEPAFWAVEGLDRHEYAVAVAAMAQRGGRRARCLVTGGHASYDDLQHRLQVAAPIPGWSGFAIGRGIWWDPLRAHLRHLSTAGEARRRIRAAFLDYADYYLQARDGTLSDGPDPVL